MPPLRHCPFFQARRHHPEQCWTGEEGRRDGAEGQLCPRGPPAGSWVNTALYDADVDPGCNGKWPPGHQDAWHSLGVMAGSGPVRPEQMLL